MAGPNRLEHPFGRRPVDRRPKRHVRRDVDDVQPLRGEQHPGSTLPGQVREQPGVAVVVVAGRVQGFLVDRSGDDAGGAPGLRPVHGGSDVLEAGLAASGAENAEAVGQAFDRNVDHRDAVAAASLDERQIDAARRERATKNLAIAHDGEVAPLGGVEAGQRLHRYLGANARGVAHGDNDRAVMRCGHCLASPCAGDSCCKLSNSTGCAGTYPYRIHIRYARAEGPFTVSLFRFTADMFTCMLRKTQSGLTMRVLIIADDLTGALDSAVTLTGTGLRCVVARRPDHVAAALEREPDVLAVNTASREGSAEAARAAIAAAVDAVGPMPEIVFKKVDSRLKGHVGDEVAVLAERAGRRRALVAPAIPAQGRIVAGGSPDRVRSSRRPSMWRGPSARAGSRSRFRIPGAMRTSTPRSNTSPRGRRRCSLARPVWRRRSVAGFARAVRAAAVPKLRRPILLAIGSHDPITLAQVERLAGRGAWRSTTRRTAPAHRHHRGSCAAHPARPVRRPAIRRASVRRALRGRDCATCHFVRLRDAARLRRRDRGRYPAGARARRSRDRR